MAKALRVVNPKKVGKRKCGNCVGCCQTPSLRVPDLKEFGESCKHVMTGKKRGCGIYETRPAGCKAYQCHWLLNGFLETKHRPDKIGIIFDDGQIRLDGFWKKVGTDLGLPLPPVTAREIWPGAYKRQKALLDQMSSELVIIKVRNPNDPTSKLEVIGPNQEVINGVAKAISELSKELASEG